MTYQAKHTQACQGQEKPARAVAGAIIRIEWVIDDLFVEAAHDASRIVPNYLSHVTLEHRAEPEGRVGDPKEPCQ
jgi:hypothetical protein